MYKVINSDFESIVEVDFDFLISSMVRRHLDDETLNNIVTKEKHVIKTDRLLIFLVPSNMGAWGIEDEIAGHVKRYSFKDLQVLVTKHILIIETKIGLNYPVSNWLLNISNKIVKTKEAAILNKSEKEKTVYAGNENIKYRTVYPTYLNLILNEIVMYPFHVIQKIFRNEEKSLVVYFELTQIK